MITINVLFRHKESIVHKLRIRKVENSSKTTLRKKTLKKLRIRKGDIVFVAKVSDGVQLTSTDSDFEKAMQAYWKVSTKYRNALRELAK